VIICGIDIDDCVMIDGEDEILRVSIVSQPFEKEATEDIDIGGAERIIAHLQDVFDL